jgi:hypothetical protein
MLLIYTATGLTSSRQEKIVHLRKIISGFAPGPKSARHRENPAKNAQLALEWTKGTKETARTGAFLRLLAPPDFPLSSARSLRLKRFFSKEANDKVSGDLFFRWYN